jgi:hypothetical protein
LSGKHPERTAIILDVLEHRLMLAADRPIGVARLEMSPAPLAQQNANIAEESKKVLAALQGTWKLAIREEVGKEGTDIGDPRTINNDRLVLQFPHRSLLNWSLFARVGPTTPKQFLRSSSRAITWKFIYTPTESCGWGGALNERSVP